MTTDTSTMGVTANGRLSLRRTLRSVRALPRGTAFPTLRASWLHSSRPLHELPIVAGPGTRIDAAPDAQLRLDGQLFLGYAPDRAEENDPGGLPPVGRARLSLSSGAVFATGGWVVLGPGCHVAVGKNAYVGFGEASYITSDTRVFAQEQITIGRACAIAWDVLLMDHDAHWLEIAGRPRRGTAPIVIHDHVWIGAKATVLKGVTLGEGAVVGAGSVVTKDVAPRTVVAGSPARVVAEDAEWW